MDSQVYQNARILWDYMNLHMPLQQAQCILGFGSYDLETARRCAELYLEGWAPRILFTGGLGRNTRSLYQQSEAERFRDLAVSLGVPESAIALETQSANTGENIRFSRSLLENQGISRILAVTKPFMERRVKAAFGVFWPEAQVCLASPRLDLLAYIERSKAQGMPEQRVLEILTGDFQRLQVYADKGYQLPQAIPQQAWDAFDCLCSRGYTRDLI